MRAGRPRGRNLVDFTSLGNRRGPNRAALRGFLARLLEAPAFAACLLAGQPLTWGPDGRLEAPRGLRPEDRWRGKALNAALEKQAAFLASPLHEPPPRERVDPLLLGRAEGLLLLRLAFPEPGDDEELLRQLLALVRREAAKVAEYGPDGRLRRRRWGGLISEAHRIGRRAGEGRRLADPEAVGKEAVRFLSSLLADARKALQAEADERQRERDLLLAQAGPLKGRPRRLARLARRFRPR